MGEEEFTGCCGVRRRSPYHPRRSAKSVVPSILPYLITMLAYRSRSRSRFTCPAPAFSLKDTCESECQGHKRRKRILIPTANGGFVREPRITRIARICYHSEWGVGAVRVAGKCEICILIPKCPHGGAPVREEPPTSRPPPSGWLARSSTPASGFTGENGSEKMPATAARVVKLFRPQ